MADTIDFLHPLSTPQRLADIFELVGCDVTAKDIAQTLRGQAAENNALADLIDPPAEVSGLVRFEQIPVGASVRILGEWHNVLGKSVDTDFDGSQAKRLWVAEPGRDAWWYTLDDDDELCPIESPF